MNTTLLLCHKTIYLNGGGLEGFPEDCPFHRLIAAGGGETTVITIEGCPVRGQQQVQTEGGNGGSGTWNKSGVLVLYSTSP